jgi:hypothetical protein
MIENKTDDNSLVLQFQTPLLSFPKILKKDIRRRYAEMFAIMANTVDMNLSEMFFKEFSRPKMEFLQSSGEYDVPVNHTKYGDFQLGGLDMFLQFWYNQMHLAPDICWRIFDPKIVSVANSNESRVEFDFELKLTVLVDLPYSETIPTLEDCEGLFNSQQGNVREKKRKVSTNNTVYSDRFFNRIKSCEIRAHPLEVKILGVMKMYLDTQKMIQKMHFHGEKKEFSEMK